MVLLHCPSGCVVISEAAMLSLYVDFIGGTRTLSHSESFGLFPQESLTCHSSSRSLSRYRAENDKKEELCALISKPPEF